MSGNDAPFPLFFNGALMWNPPIQTHYRIASMKPIISALKLFFWKFASIHIGWYWVQAVKNSGAMELTQSVPKCILASSVFIIFITSPPRPDLSNKSYSCLPKATVRGCSLLNLHDNHESLLLLPFGAQRHRLRQALCWELARPWGGGPSGEWTWGGSYWWRCDRGADGKLGGNGFG